MNDEPPSHRRVQQHGAWRVGDRLWTEWDGTCVIHALGVRGVSKFPDALIEVLGFPGEREWIVLTELLHHRLSPDEPDRPNTGLKLVKVGRILRHRKFGSGTVVQMLKDDEGLPVARMDFGPTHGVQDIALASGQLRPTVVVLRADNCRWDVWHED